MRIYYILIHSRLRAGRHGFPNSSTHCLLNLICGIHTSGPTISTFSKLSRAFLCIKCWLVHRIRTVCAISSVRIHASISVLSRKGAHPPCASIMFNAKLPLTSSQRTVSMVANGLIAFACQLMRLPVKVGFAPHRLRFSG